MSEITWEKVPSGDVVPASRGGRWKLFVGGLLILGAVAYLVISGTATGARFFINVDDLLKNSAYVGQSVRVTGAVLGDSIQYDSENLVIEFTVVNVPEEYDNLAEALHLAVNNPEASRLNVRVENQVKPDLLQHEAQAILTGTMDENGVFHATELLLKCPSRMGESVPDPSIAGQTDQDA